MNDEATSGGKTATVAVNVPMDFNLGLIESIRVEPSAAIRRAATLGTRRTFKQEAQASAYIRAIQCMDLTTLAGDDTPGRVERLCAKAKQPVRREILAAHGLEDFPLTVGAVCVYHAQIETAMRCLQGSGIPVAAVSAGFPDGQTPHRTKLEEIRASIEAGAREIDVVISREHALTGSWLKLYDQVCDFRRACGNEIRLKVIHGTGNLGTLECVARATAVTIMAGADFVKTSTGKEGTNATLPVGLVMVRQMRRFMQIDPARRIAFKPAGGIKTAKDVMLWFILMKEELGEDWTKPDLFRIGASSLLTDLERQLEHLATGRYAAEHHQPMA